MTDVLQTVMSVFPHFSGFLIPRHQGKGEVGILVLLVPVLERASPLRLRHFSSRAGLSRSMAVVGNSEVTGGRQGKDLQTLTLALTGGLNRLSAVLDDR